MVRCCCRCEMDRCRECPFITKDKANLKIAAELLKITCPRRFNDDLLHDQIQRFLKRIGED